MSALTLKSIPPELLQRLRERAVRDRRSLNREVLVLLEQALAASPATVEDRVRAQVDAWIALAGEWRSDRAATDEIEEIYASRTPGREVRL
jgi:plasmid stability protein